MPSETTSPAPITQPTLVLVEGIDDKRVFEALIKHIRLADMMEVADYEGTRNLGARLRILKGRSGFNLVTSLAIVRDADDNPRGAFQSVCSALRQAELPVPGRPLAPAGENPRVGVMILPDADTSGMLETVCLDAVKDDPAVLCVEQYFECLQQRGISLRENVLQKAKIHTFLASRNKPDLRLGEAAQAGYLPWEHPAFDDVKTFLENIVS